MQLQGKRILLGVTGSIAAYKAAHLTRLLVKEGAEVQIIMSTSALDFITPLTLATLSKKPVLEAFYDRKSGDWSNHVDLGLWADLFLVAPLSANTLSKFANGGCDNLLTATYLSARCPVMVAPAMDLDMYQHPSVKANLDRLASFGNIILEAESGELASGLMGQGRLMEPEHIVKRIHEHFSAQQDFKGKTVLITAGPTHEAIDPVRFIGNHSSGKMGIALANALAQHGADVKLVLGPSSLSPSHSNVSTFRVKSADEMFEICKKHHSKADFCIFAAAVADYTPEEVATQKIKKNDDDMVIRLKKNVDIAATLGKKKKAYQVHIGFALETNQEEENALGKLNRKNFDMVVLNSMNDNGAGFQHDTNKVTFYFKDGHKEPLTLLPKTEVATQIIQAIKKISSKN
ncbi:bifunctional phosphopantothenoylcysteine decarboxylase/phosphopantothenate--cysteine ligase CoaBC [Litoribacter populi]|uniref:bifunctional phosphopantothenoylcysteine decarboxylase/phosphopantothenate--cysteine ligase CoaBC n=1 Tax=Litoribacter populi TaxID=2598460 RepID=UPI001180462F|nr:bifunctional phosphopantothenoylcysteine decarboxylase/phosphopantothenate--cysteine ligase CoaBC [Litoribacter populi]